MRFTDLFLDMFWISVKEECAAAIHRKAIYIPLQFSSSYVCEREAGIVQSV
jgi:hypothetical protein